MIMGLPCSGKSTFAQKLAEEYNTNLHSSDAIREELTGDINNQEHNNEVFQTLHKRIKDDLRNGKSCIYDACNISYKQRMAFLSELKNIPCEKQCMLMATPYEWCIERSAKRESKVPSMLLKECTKALMFLGTMRDGTKLQLNTPLILGVCMVCLAIGLIAL